MPIRKVSGERPGQRNDPPGRRQRELKTGIQKQQRIVDQDEQGGNGQGVQRAVAGLVPEAGGQANRTDNGCHDHRDRQADHSGIAPGGQRHESEGGAPAEAQHPGQQQEKHQNKTEM